MGVFICDTARNNLTKWTKEAVQNGYATGAYLSPFTSPKDGNKHKKSAIKTSKEIKESGGEFWFDPMTYALDMPRTSNYGHYDTWNLWKGRPGDISSPQIMHDHILRVYSVQKELASPLLAPTKLMNHTDSSMALKFSEEAISIDATAWLTIAGNQQFWSAGRALDVHIGALDQLEPQGWLLVVARPDSSMPPNATAEEIYGLMRTTYALSQDRPVRVAFGDLAALPAVAAGAEAIGTGWDLRQRICAYQDFEERENAPSGGGWYQRPTLQGLLGGLSKKEYSMLESERRRLSLSLTPGTIGPKIQQAFQHHATTLTKIVNDLSSLARGRERVAVLQHLYLTARPEWEEVERITGCLIGPKRWIDPFLKGIELFAKSEGWRQ